MADNPGTNPGFLLAEDAALKMRLASMAVSDDRNTSRPVQVFYRHPEKTTEKSYPFATIEMFDIKHDTEVQHSFTDLYYADGEGISPEKQAELTYVDYYPSEYNEEGLQDLVDGGGFLRMDSFTPVTLTYQVTTYCRSARHDRQLTSLILRRIFPLMGRGWLEIPEDGTLRRLTLLDWRPADILDGEAGYKKRLFRKVYTVTINAELATSDIAATTRALSVHGNLNGHTTTVTNDPITTEEFS